MANFIDFPTFDGVSGDLWQWILWLEDFFVRERFTADEKMNLAQSLLEGKAYAWFYRNQKILIFQSWEELRDTLWLTFGDYADLDRFFQEQRVKQKRKQMKITSIPEKDSIWETETEALVPTDTIPVTNLIESRETTDSTLVTKSIQEAISESVLDGGASCEKDESHADTTREEESIHQNQVPVSSLEPSLSFSSEPLDVSASWPCAIVSTNPVHSQSGLESVKNMSNAYQVFDKTSPHKERLKQKTKRKLSLSLKTWMFKFKSTSKRRTSLDVKSVSVEEIAWLMRDSNVIYRSCVDKEFKAVVAGCGKLFDRFQTSPYYALDVVNTTTKPWDTHNTFTSTHVASVNSLSFAVGTADTFELCVGHDKDIMRLKLLLYSGCDGEKLAELDFHFGVNLGLLVFPWHLMLLEFFLFLQLEDKACLSAASNSCYGWMVFDRGKNIKILGDVITLKRDVQTDMWTVQDVQSEKAKDVHVDSLIVRIKEFWIANMVEINTGDSWAELKWITWSVSSNIVEVYTKTIDKLQKKLKQGMDLHGASGYCSSDEMNQFLSSIGLVDALYSGLGENVHALLAAEVHESVQQQSDGEATKVNVNSETRHGVCIILIFKREPKLEGNHEMRGLLGISMSCFRDTGSVLVMVLYFNLEGKKWYTKRQQTSSSTWHRWRRKD